MKKVIQLKEKLASNLKFKTKYDLSEDDKIHLLYVSPKFNATGYYRLITQALELDQTKTHKSIITNIDNNDFNNSLNDLTTVLDERLLVWADYIIFPPIFSDITYLLKAIQSFNPLIQIAFIVDQNYFALNSMSFGKRKIAETELLNLENNLACADLLLVANLKFKNFLHRFINIRHPNADVVIQFIPNLISKIGYESMSKIIKNDTGLFRVGLIKPTFEDLNFVKELFKKMNKKLKEKIQVVCLGGSSTYEIIEKFDILNDIEFHRTVNFENFFLKLNQLKLDSAMLLAKDSIYNKHHSSYLFLELSAFGIPTITSIYHPAKEYIDDGVNGILAAEEPEWIKALDLLMNVKDIKEEIANRAIKNVWKHHSFSKKQIQNICEEIFF
ncbi:glycosyltransferase [Kordia jejudonensis]|uniref:glycosyltransferase n=1 Tax=Kordia jejudonensis TaxID=1348245 RepID=UPI0006291F1A|nr:glycosyltransferase [Kordia jejudonensis]